MNAGRRLNRQQDIMRLRVPLTDIMHVIRRQQRNAKLLRQLFQLRIHHFILRQPVILNLQEEIIHPENILKLQRFPSGPVIIPVQQTKLNPAGETGRQGDDALTVRPEFLFINPRLEIKSPFICIGDNLNQIVVSLIVFCQKNQMTPGPVLHRILILHAPHRGIHFTSDDRLDSLLPAFFIEINDTEHSPMIRDRQRIHAHFLRLRRRLRNPRHPVEKTVFRVDV